VLAGRALAPVAAMADQARRMGADRLGDRLEVANPDDELGRLAAVLNELLGRIETAFDRMRHFVADASHELRTPVGVIRSGTAVALTPPVTVEECVETLRVIDDQAARLGRLVDDMFTLARADAGDPALLESDPVPLGELVASCAAAAQPLAAAAGVAFEFPEPPEDERFCRGDRVRLEQMLMNLVTNAIRHSGRGGRVRIGLALAGPGGGEAAISVSDTGHGVPPEAREAIFGRFVRLDAARSRETGGGGLGLPIARWVAEAHGGSIGVGDAPGGGAEFTVRLPLDPAPDGRPVPPRPARVSA
jgi:signal transduction histidine kinase